MESGRLFPDLIATLGRATSAESGFTRTLKHLVTLSGATSGGLHFVPGRGAPIVVTAGTRRGSALDAWLRARLAEPVKGMRLAAVKEPPPGWRGSKPVMLSAALGDQEGS